MNEMKDWPLKLRLNAAACMLAPSLYYATIEVYGGHAVHFDALSPEHKETVIEAAADAIMSAARRMKHGQPTTGLRPITRSNVIGSIAPPPGGES